MAKQLKIDKNDKGIWRRVGMKNEKFLTSIQKGIGRGTILDINKIDDGKPFTIKLNHCVDFVGVSNEAYKSIQKQHDDFILKKLYKEYKDYEIVSHYILNKDEFKRFLLEMLPLWLKKEKKYEKIKRTNRKRKSSKKIR